MFAQSVNHVLAHLSPMCPVYTGEAKESTPASKAEPQAN